jgi:hypothetical protein
MLQSLVEVLLEIETRGDIKTDLLGSSSTLLYMGNDSSRLYHLKQRAQTLKRRHLGIRGGDKSFPNNLLHSN